MDRNSEALLGFASHLLSRTKGLALEMAKFINADTNSLDSIGDPSLTNVYRSINSPSAGSDLALLAATSAVGQLLFEAENLVHDGYGEEFWEVTELFWEKSMKLFQAKVRGYGNADDRLINNPRTFRTFFGSGSQDFGRKSARTQSFSQK